MLALIALVLYAGCAEDPAEVNDDDADVQPPGPVDEFSAEAQPGKIVLSWETPDPDEEKRNRDYKGVLILRAQEGIPDGIPLRETDYVAGETIGTSLVVYAGRDESHEEADLAPGVKYYYTAYSYDEVPNYGEPQLLNATPASMVQARFSHTATLLPDGRVVLIGGVGFAGPLDTAEMFNPFTDNFTLADSRMRVPRYSHSAALLHDGRILVTGGFEEGFTEALDTATLFDPDQMRFVALDQQMASVRALHTSTVLPDGTVLIAGGSDGADSLCSVEVFDPADGSFSTLEPGMSRVRASHTSTGYFDGQGEYKVLLAGGYDGEQSIDAAEIFDFMTWTFGGFDGQAGGVGNLAESRLAHSADPVSIDGEQAVLLCGGFLGNDLTGAPTTGCELFFPLPGSSGRVEQTGSMGVGRTGHGSSLLPDGSVVIAGGIDARLEILDSAEVFDPITGLFYDVGALTDGRTVHRLTLLPDERVLVSGGNGSGNLLDPMPVSRAEAYDPSSAQFAIVGAGD